MGNSFGYLNTEDSPDPTGDMTPNSQTNPTTPCTDPCWSNPPKYVQKGQVDGSISGGVWDTSLDRTDVQPVHS
jgi:hypothetical protein